MLVTPKENYIQNRYFCQNILESLYADVNMVMTNLLLKPIWFLSTGFVNTSVVLGT
jgi:hypothetical protein